MKTIHQWLLAFTASLFLFLGPLSLLTIGGCTTTEDLAYKTIGTTTITANGAMRGWLDYKNTHNVPQEQIDSVRSAWNKFYAANQAERDATIAFKTNTDTNALTRAISISTTASADLIRVIMLFLPPEKAAELKGVK